MTYDEALEKLSKIVSSLETGEALSMEEYKQKAKEAQQLIAFCREQLTGVENDFRQILNTQES